jgi:hypothetical protein
MRSRSVGDAFLTGALNARKRSALASSHVSPAELSGLHKDSLKTVLRMGLNHAIRLIDDARS